MCDHCELRAGRQGCGLPWRLSSEESPANAGDTGGRGSIPGSEDLLEKEMATYSSMLAWEIPWAEEPGGLQSIGCKELDMTHTHSQGCEWQVPV